jgi:phosphoribosylformylglycinamidine cyclo-ligase
MNASTAAYSRAGVDQDLADLAVNALVRALKPTSPAFKSRQVLPSGHFANVMRLDSRLGIALSADGVGTKILIAEALERFDTIGIDCVAMNVNDVLCVGAEPIAMLDYLAVDTADPKREGQIGAGLRRGAELAGIEIPGGELAQLGDIVNGFDLAGACFGSVALDSILDGKEIRPGDSVIGLPSTGLHANGYTLARRALDGLSLDSDPENRLGRPLGDVLMEPTEIYVKPVLELLHSEIAVRGLAHITSLGFENLLRLDAQVGYEIDDPLPVPPIFNLIQERGSVGNEEMRQVFNLGCGFCCVVAHEVEEEALRSLHRHYPEARRIGRVVEGEPEVHYPPGWPSAASVS